MKVIIAFAMIRLAGRLNSLIISLCLTIHNSLLVTPTYATISNITTVHMFYSQAVHVIIQ